MSDKALAQMARSIAAIVDESDPLVRFIRDRGALMDLSFVESVLRQSVIGWAGRSPSPAYDEDGTFVGSDLDLASMLVPLSQRRAVIEIPNYKNRRPLVMRAGMRKIGTSSFGPLTRIVSHKEVFSFSVHIRDQSVAVEQNGVEVLGHPMNYMVVDIDGTWHEGCDVVRFKPGAEENEFFLKHGLVKDGEMRFKYFAHPNRFQSIFGAPYLRIMVLIARLDEEAAFYRGELKRLADLGIFPKKEESPETEYEGSRTSVRVDAFETRLDLPPLSKGPEDFGLPPGDTVQRAQEAYERERSIRGTLKPRAQFVRRADEFAYRKFGLADDRRPAWAEPLTIERDVREEGGRTKWNRFQIAPGFALRFRNFIKSEQVAA